MSKLCFAYNSLWLFFYARCHISMNWNKKNAILTSSWNIRGKIPAYYSTEKTIRAGWTHINMWQLVCRWILLDCVVRWIIWGSLLLFGILVYWMVVPCLFVIIFGRYFNPMYLFIYFWIGYFNPMLDVCRWLLCSFRLMLVFFLQAKVRRGFCFQNKSLCIQYSFGAVNHESTYAIRWKTRMVESRDRRSLPWLELWSTTLSVFCFWSIVIFSSKNMKIIYVLVKK